MAYLEWRGISKSFGAERVLDGVSLTMEKGEILALLGPSGSGKTTLLRITCGLDRPDSGEVILDGKNLTGIPTHMRSMGLMFQDYGLFPHLDVEGNVGFGLRMKRWPRPTRRRRVQEMLDMVRLGSAGKRSVSTLSGGEKQRIALARSLAPSPSLLMLDEPFGALDAVLRGELLGELPAILRRAEGTVLYVTHDREEAFGVADRIALIRKGTIVQVGTPEELVSYPAHAFTASFLGLGAIVPAAVRRGRIETDVGDFDWKEGALGQGWPGAEAVRDGKPAEGGHDNQYLEPNAQSAYAGAPAAGAYLLIRPAALSIPPASGTTPVSSLVLSRTPGAEGTVLRLALRGERRLYEVSVRAGHGRDLPAPGSTLEAGVDFSRTMMLPE